MSIIGVTIDYGPYGYMEHFDQKHICNHSDNEGRYRYEAQPGICAWNLELLRKTIQEFLPSDYTLVHMEENFKKHYSEAYNSKMQQKLGLDSPDEILFKELFETMQMTASDFTNTFRVLANLKKSGENSELIAEELASLAAPKE